MRLKLSLNNAHYGGDRVVLLVAQSTWACTSPSVLAISLRLTQVRLRPQVRLQFLGNYLIMLIVSSRRNKPGRNHQLLTRVQRTEPKLTPFNHSI